MSKVIDRKVTMIILSKEGMKTVVQFNTLALYSVWKVQELFLYV